MVKRGDKKYIIALNRNNVTVVKTKNPFFLKRVCTRSRDRTGTALLPLVFETSASTNSAIRASKEQDCENIKNFCLYYFCLLSFFPLSLSYFLTRISLIAISIPSASNPHSLYSSSCVPCSTK